MAARRFQGQRGRSRPGGRSPTAWAGFLAADATVAAATAQIVGSFFPSVGSPHETIVRFVGDWQVDGVGVNGTVVVGGVVVTDAAFAAGAASIPDPITEISDDNWMFISSATVATSARALYAEPLKFDSRAMRRLEEGTRLAIMIANGTDGNIGFAMYIRALAKVAVRS